MVARSIGGSRPARLGTLLAAAGLVASLQAGCAAGTGGGPPTRGAVPVVASTDVYGSVARAIGGTHVTITSIVHSPDVDPHEYAPDPRDGLAMSRARILIVNGGGYDNFVGKLAAASGAHPTTINVSQLSGLDHGPDFNEHVWYDLPTVRALADTLAADLSHAEPGDAPTFRANAAAFDASLSRLADRVAAVKSAHAGARVAATEPVPLYLVQAAGLVNTTPPEFSNALEEGIDPPATALAQMLALVHGPDRARALLVNVQTEGPVTNQVVAAARAGGVPVVEVTETLPAGSMDYVSWMGAQIDRLASALGGS
jgi:zinc/manganese transport system substrate-binding protein